jgi:hypothetical protein
MECNEKGRATGPSRWRKVYNPRVADEERYIDPVVRAYMADVDRTLLRENLRKTPEERLRALQEMQRAAEELAKAGKRSRRRG